MPLSGTLTSMSTRLRPAASTRTSAASETIWRTSGWTTALPRSTATATRRAFDAAGAETSLPAFLAGEAEGVARVIARRDVVPARGVADAAGDGALDGGELADRGARTAGNAAEGPLHADKTAIRGRDADAATAVAGGGGRYEATSDRRRGASGRAGWSAVEVPGVAGNAVELRGSVGDEAELGGSGLADEDGACSAEPGDVGGVLCGDVFLEN